MAQRRWEKPKKVKISPKKQEFYSRLKLYSRCGGLMFYERFSGQEIEDFSGWRCISCGEIIDEVILKNRTKR